MNKTHLDIWAEEIIKKTGFKPEKEIRRADYYSFGKIRVLIMSGQYQIMSGQYQTNPAILKIYDDPRISEEPLSQNKFNQQNKSKILKALKVYEYEIASPQKGWLIMEKLPEQTISLKRPIKPEQRKEFLEIYLEYRKNFPTKPTRALTLSENLPAHLFHIFRINRWFQLANDKEAELTLFKKNPALKPKEFIPRFEKGINLIRQEFKKRKMIWCHGLFNPTKIFKDRKQNIYYLIDFGHNKMYPEGYELAFIIWADWFLESDWQMDYPEWKKGIDEWLSELKPIAAKLKIKDFQSLMKAGLTERCLGTILADICATDRPKKEKGKRIALLYKLLDELL